MDALKGRVDIVTRPGRGFDRAFALLLAAKGAAMDAAWQRRHKVARATFVHVDGTVQPAPAPRFNGAPAGAVSPPTSPGTDTLWVLAGWGVDEALDPLDLPARSVVRVCDDSGSSKALA